MIKVIVNAVNAEFEEKEILQSEHYAGFGKATILN